MSGGSLRLASLLLDPQSHPIIRFPLDGILYYMTHALPMFSPVCRASESKAGAVFVCSSSSNKAATATAYLASAASEKRLFSNLNSPSADVHLQDLASALGMDVCQQGTYFKIEMGCGTWWPVGRDDAGLAVHRALRLLVGLESSCRSPIM